MKGSQGPTTRARGSPWTDELIANIPARLLRVSSDVGAAGSTLRSDARQWNHRYPEDRMTIYGSTGSTGAVVARPLWVCVLLGIVLIAAGLIALSDVAFATVVSVKLIGLTAIAAGGFEIAHAFWTRGWGGFLWQILLGALYVAFGLVLLTQPASGALILTYLLGAVLFASGIIRSVLSFAHWPQNGWMMLISGVFAVLAGLLILFGFPNISVWGLGLLLGADLISHGLAWLLYALQSVRRTT
jgi:uncharacterized membrane protein HdeD (DUF308 family)